MKQLLGLLMVASMALGAPGAPEKPRLGDRHLIGSYQWYPSCSVSSGLAQMQLSPDGKRVFYAQRTNAAEYEKYMLGNGKQPPERWKWEILTIGGGLFEFEMPQFDDLDALLPFLAGNAFSPDGEHIAVPIGVDENNDGVCSVGREKMRLELWDIGRKSPPRTLEVSSPLILPMFAPLGKKLIVATGGPGIEDLQILVLDLETAKPGVKTLGIPGLPGPPAPKDDLLPVLVSQRATNGKRGGQALVLWDYQADKKVADVSADPALASSIPAVWSEDGRYLSYAVGAPPRSFETRIWDRSTNSVVATLKGALPVGPGPAPATLVADSLTEESYSGGTFTGHEVVLYEIGSGRRWPLSDAFPSVITARAGRVVFATREEESEFEVRCQEILFQGR